MLLNSTNVLQFYYSCTTYIVSIISNMISKVFFQLFNLRRFQITHFADILSVHQLIEFYSRLNVNFQTCCLNILINSSPGNAAL